MPFALDGCPQCFGYEFGNRGLGEGRHLVLQQLQFIGQFRAQEIPARGKQLPELDIDRPKLLHRLPQPDVAVTGGRGAEAERRAIQQQQQAQRSQTPPPPEEFIQPEFRDDIEYSDQARQVGHDQRAFRCLERASKDTTCPQGLTTRSHNKVSQQGLTTRSHNQRS